LEDLAGEVEVLFFPNTYELVGQYVAEDAIVVVRGRVDRRDDQPRLMAMDLEIPDLTAVDSVRPVVLALQANRCTPPMVEKLREVLTSHPGPAEVHVKLLSGSKATLLRLGPTRVDPSTALMASLMELLGPAAVVCPGVRGSASAPTGGAARPHRSAVGVVVGTAVGAGPARTRRGPRGGRGVRRRRARRPAR